MSIADEIIRLDAGKEAIIAAITQKGEAVPDGALFSDLAAIVEQISATDIPEPLVEVEYQTVTIANDKATLTVYHGMEAAPTGALLYNLAPESAYYIRGGFYFLNFAAFASGQKVMGLELSSLASTYPGISKNGSAASYADYIYISLPHGSDNYTPFYQGDQYAVIMWR